MRKNYMFFLALLAIAAVTIVPAKAQSGQTLANRVPAATSDEEPNNGEWKNYEYDWEMKCF